MRQFLVYERRLQDLETRLNNMSRRGEVSEVKFDDEKKRWYVKMQDGEGENTTFKSGWLPWRSFSHGSISMSVPPRKGMKVAYNAPGGQPEQATVEPYHYDPDNPAPHGKQDEMVRLIEHVDEQGQGGQSSSGQQQDKYENWVHETKDSHQVIIRKKPAQQSQPAQQQSGQQAGGGDQEGKPKKERKLPEVPEAGATDTVQVKTTKDGHLITVGNAQFKMTSSALTIKIGGVTWTLNSSGWKQEGGGVHHDTKNIGKTHIHGGVTPGGSDTDVPEDG